MKTMKKMVALMAAVLLLCSVLPLSMAAAVGYANPQYFHRLFRKRTGMTPTEYRRRNR